MSSTGRKDKTRQPADFYATPPYPVRALLDTGALIHRPNVRWLEPAAGDGAIIRAVTEWCLEASEPVPSWHAVEARRAPEQDLRQAATLAAAGATVEIEDFLDLAPPSEPYDVALGNVPYRLAYEFTRKLVDEQWALRVALLMRIGFLESGSRYDWLRDNMPDVYGLSSRPSFVGGSTDSAMYAWLVWHPFARRGPHEPRIHLLPPRTRTRSLTGGSP